MSEVITESQTDLLEVEDEDAPLEPAEVTLEDAFRAIEDGSHLAEGHTPESLVERISAAATKAKSNFVRLTNSYKSTAHEVARALRVTILPSGVPDWAGDSQTAQTILTFSLDKVLNALGGDRKRVRQAIMAHLNRTYLDMEMVDYVSEMTTLDGTPLYPNGADETDPGIMAAFTAQVRKQYKDAGLAVPSKYQTQADKEAASNGGGGPGSGISGAMQAVRKGIEGLAGIKTHLATLALLEGLSALVQRIEAGEAQFSSADEKRTVGELLHRTANVALYGAKAIDGNVKPNDRDVVTSSYYNADEDEKEV